MENWLAQRVENRESFLLGNDGAFLGTLTLSQHNPESVSNHHGPFGSQYSAPSIFNPYGNYGSPYSALSPYNHYTNTPPLVYLNGQFAGYLTKNAYMGTNTIDPDRLVHWMGKNQLNY